VRNPFSRVLSAYLDKVDGGGKQTFRKELGIGAEALSFRGFLERLEDGCLCSNIHWTPQTSIVPLQPSALDFIGRVETIDRDLPCLLERIFGAGEYPVVQAGKRTTRASSRLSEYYGDAEIGLVRRLYAQDFDALYPAAPDPA
jgi:hypothetical protein